MRSYADTYSYDTRELATAMTDPAGRVIRFANDTSGRRTDTWFNSPNTANSSFAAHTHTDYDASSRIAEVWTSQNSSDTTKVSDLAYGYGYDSDAGRCTASLAAGTDTGLRWVAHNKISNIYTNYCYDTSNRLVLADPGVGDTYAYTYDANGNRLTTTTNATLTQTQTVNAADQLTMAGYSYDANGNTTADSHGTEVYNGADQMTSLTAGYTTTTYTYAGTDQTELTTAPNRNYTYGRTASTGLPLVESFTDSTSTFSYLYDPKVTPLAIEGGMTHYLALDGLGSIIATINHLGATTTTYAYDPWGTQTTTPVGGSAIGNYQLYGYTGGITDQVTNLVHLGHRWYDTTTGRFTQPDATGQDPHYTYGANSPVTYTDPSGDCSPPYCRSLSNDATAAVQACASTVAVRTGVGGLLVRFFGIFRVTLGGLAVSCVTGIVGAALRSGPLISTTRP